MRRALLMLVLLGPAFAGAAAQQKAAGTVTFISGDVYYTSLGRAAGVADSALVYVMTPRGDTTAVLKAFALSSKSSACRMVAGAKPPRVGDTVTAWVSPPAPAEQAAVAADTAQGPAAVPAAPSPRAADRPQPVQGRIALQYRTYVYAGSNADITQPSVAVSLRGAVPDAPLRFELQGNFRSTVLGSQNPFSAGGINQSRIYRLTVAYDDGENRAAVGRMLAGTLSSAGYIDGVALERRIGAVTVGGAFGFEPDFAQRTFTSDRKKFSVYASLDPRAGLPVTAGLGYARSFFGTALDRDVVSAHAAVAASPSWYATAQAEVDLHTWRGGALESRPRLTSVVANGSWRAAPEVTLNAGVTAWRPVFPLSVIAGIADSLLDRTLWASPSIGVSIYPQAGFFFQETYAPRTSAAGFAREYYNAASAGAWNLFDQGTNLRVTWTANATTGTRTQGYAVAADQHLVSWADLTLRWQYYGYTFTALDERATGRALGADLTVRFLRQFTLWTTYEYSTGFSGDYTYLGADLSWRF